MDKLLALSAAYAKQQTTNVCACGLLFRAPDAYGREVRVCSHAHACGHRIFPCDRVRGYACGDVHARGYGNAHDRALHPHEDDRGREYENACDHAHVCAHVFLSLKNLLSGAYLCLILSFREQ